MNSYKPSDVCKICSISEEECDYRNCSPSTCGHFKPRQVEGNPSKGVKPVPPGSLSGVSLCFWKQVRKSWEGNKEHKCVLCGGRDQNCGQYLKEGV